jgi:Ca2+-binding EF-hand superfamily protein
LDFNDDGSLSFREIRGATKQLGEKMSTKELRMFFSVADKNGDRKISKEELADVLSSYTHESGSGL